MALAGVIGPVCRDAAGLLVRRCPAEQVRQHRCIANGAACHFDSAYFQCVLIKTDVGLAPEAAFGATVLACVPFALPFGLDDSAVCPCCPPASAADLLSPDRPWAALTGNGNRQGLLPSTQPAVVSNVAIGIDQPQQAFHQPGRLSQRQAKQHLYRQTGLDCSIAIMWAITWLAATFARGPGSPIRLAIKPDRKGAALLQAMMINRPVPGLLCRRGPTAHSKPRPCWSHVGNPCHTPFVKQSRPCRY